MPYTSEAVLVRASDRRLEYFHLLFGYPQPCRRDNGHVALHSLSNVFHVGSRDLGCRLVSFSIIEAAAGIVDYVSTRKWLTCLIYFDSIWADVQVPDIELPFCHYVVHRNSENVSAEPGLSRWVGCGTRN